MRARNVMKMGIYNSTIHLLGQDILKVFGLRALHEDHIDGALGVVLVEDPSDPQPVRAVVASLNNSLHGL